MATGEGIMETLHHIRDLHSILESEHPDSDGMAAHLRCIVVKKIKNKKIKNKIVTLFRIQDDSGVIQAVLEKDEDDIEAWNLGKCFQSGDSIEIVGKLSNGYPKPSVIIERIESSGENNGITENQKALRPNNSLTQTFLARIKRLVRTHYENDTYVEISTRLISSTPIRDDGVYPLQVVYNGFGASFHITPSPVPQLINCLANTSYNKIFTMSRCFTQTYRDPVASVESVVISVASRSETIEKLLFEVDSMLREILASPHLGEKDSYNFPNTNKCEFDRIDAHSSAVVDSPQVQIFTDQNDDILVGRLCWPLNSIDYKDRNFSEYVIAEGYSAGSTEEPAFATMTINLERLITLLFDKTDLRRMPSLSMLDTI